MAQISLTARDIDLIGRVVDTEVPRSIARTNPQEYERMVGAVVDTITNRVASGLYGDTVEDVLNQDRAFSKIAGPSRLNPYGTVSAAPKAPARVQQVVNEHIKARVEGVPSEIPGAVNYANPNFSDKKNLTGWINPMIDAGAKMFGIGNAVHYHGVAPGAVPAPAHGLGAPSDFMPPVDPSLSRQSLGPMSKPSPVRPDERNVAGPKGHFSLNRFNAPVEKVTRAPLDRPASLPPDRNMPGGLLSMSNIGSLPPDRPMPSGPVKTSAPSTADLAAAYGQMADTMAQVGVTGVGSNFGSIALGAPPATPQVAPLQAPAPVQAPLQAPVQQPVAQPVRAPVQAPVQTTERLAPVNSFTTGDIYGGQVGSALASGGNTVSRDALGRTSVTNKHGVTTVSMPDGKQAATTSIGTPSAPSNGLLGGMTGQKMGGMVKGGLGAVAGAQIGGLLGPVGAVLGGYVGSQLAQGKNPLGGLTNAGTGKGLGYFPGAPTPSKKSFRDMPDVNFAGFGSGQRASAAEANRGGRGVTAGGVGLW